MCDEAVINETEVCQNVNSNQQFVAGKLQWKVDRPANAQLSWLIRGSYIFSLLTADCWLRSRSACPLRYDTMPLKVTGVELIWMKSACQHPLQAWKGGRTESAPCLSYWSLQWFQKAAVPTFLEGRCGWIFSPACWRLYPLGMTKCKEEWKPCDKICSGAVLKLFLQYNRAE